MRTTITILLASLLAGCSTIHSVHPIGSPVSGEMLDNYKNVKLDGTWTITIGDTKKSMHVKDLGDGKLSIAAVEWQGDKFELQPAEGLITQLGDRMVFNMREPKSKENPDPQWDFFLLTPIAEDDWLAVLPRVESFADAVEKHKLTGEVKRGQSSTQPSSATQGTEVILKDKPAVIEKLITETGIEHFFTTEGGVVLLRHVSTDQNH